MAPSLEFKLHYIDKCEKHLNSNSRTDSEVVLISSITEAKLLHQEQNKDQRLLVKVVVFFLCQPHSDCENLFYLPVSHQQLQLLSGFIFGLK